MRELSDRRSVITSRIGTALMYIFVWILSISFLFPIIWLVYSSLKTSQEFDVNSFSLPADPTLRNYVQVLTTTDMGRYLLNSLIVSVASVALVVFFAFIVGYFLSRFRFRGRQAIFSVFLLGMLVPVHSLMVPIYVLFSRLHLNDHLIALVLPYFAFNLPIGIYLAESYIHSIPQEMEEAASIDGASFQYTLFRIIFPMAKSILVTIAIITFFYCWNEFSFALILTTGEKMRTVPLGLALFSGSYTTNYPVMMAAMVIATLPTLVIYALLNRQIMDGMIAGAVKG